MCGGNFVINGLKSEYSGSHKDRRFNIRCCDLSKNGKWQISNIYLTGYINELQSEANYRCGYMEVLVGIYSFHKDKKEDRRFKLYCGRLAPTDGFTAVERGFVSWSDDLNEMDEALDFTTSDNKFIVGFDSYHSNHYEDRIWKVGTATLSVAICLPTAWSNYVNDYDTVTDYLCPANHALAGIQSEHYKEDRIWKFRCCDLSTSETYMLRGPEILPIANAFDGNIWEECPQDSVIVGAYSEHDIKYHDSRWQFYCSQVIEVRI